ncbi:MAG: hypothetical protein K6V97_04035 [Actinomycetia bacterium]|nr:hypothetical protein [Actinomycetes bacterium]
MDHPEVLEDFVPGPTTCPAAVNCRNAGAWCTACVWPEEAMAPSYYVPRDSKTKIPAIEARKNARRRARRAARQSVAAQRGARAKDKGTKGEREFARLVRGQRVPYSGSLGGSLSNDVVLPDGLQAEVKRRGPDAFKELYRWVLDEREQPDLVAIRADGRPWLIVQTLEHWQASRQAAPVDLAKLIEAKRLLEEALGER